MEINFLVGTYTSNSDSQGFYSISFDTDSGLSQIKSITDAINPSYLKFDRPNQTLYLVNEIADGNGTVSSFKCENMTFNHQHTSLCHGDNPCHVEVSNKNKLVFVSNYSSGSLSIFNMDENGTIGTLREVRFYEGHGPNVKRQSSSHIHSAFLNKEENMLYVQDLGSDKVHIYTINGVGEINALKTIECSPGGGPRHLAFSKDEKFVYILLELTAEIAVYRNDKDFALIQIISINKGEFHGYNCAAAIKLSQDGQYLYATNRGETNCITIYKVNHLTGFLNFVDSYDTGGLGPRDFNISPCGKYLFIANQLTNEIVIFSRDPDSGTLEDSSYRVKIPSPVCIELY